MMKAMPPAEHLEALTSEYRAIVGDPSRPFPRVETAPVRLPANELLPVEVKTGFTALLEQCEPGQPGVVRLVFPDGIEDLVVPRAAVAAELVDAAVAKIARWLSDGRNEAYVASKLAGILRGSEGAVHRLLEDATQRPHLAAAKVHDPDEIAFRFWTHLANLVLTDLKKKAEKTSDDHGACQAAWIAGYAVFWRQGRKQQELARAADRRALEGLVRKPPYLFGLEDLYDLRDAKGTPFAIKHTRSFITAFLKEKTLATEPGHLPYLVPLTAHGHAYYVQRDLVAPVFLQKLSEASGEMREQYLDAWVAALKRDERTKPMHADEAFARDVEMHTKEDYPLLAALANGTLLKQAEAETNVSEIARTELAKCFGRGTLLPLPVLLGLSRTKLLREARSYLPFWQVIPVLNVIVRLFRRLFGASKTARETDATAGPGPGEAARTIRGVDRARSARGDGSGRADGSDREAASDPKTPSPMARESLASYRKAIAGLKARVVPSGKTLPAALDDLAEKWNPLYADGPKANLVEDVNALARDFLRSLRRGFLVSPPTRERLAELAKQLASHKNLDQIRKKEPLERYLEIYFVKVLDLKR
jgi:hypothetical protein